MADIDYILEIVAKLRDDASPGIAKLKAEINSLKASQDAQSAEKDLGNAIKDTGDESEKARQKHAARRTEEERGARVTKDSGRAAENAAEKIDRVGKSHAKAGESASSSARGHQEVVEALAKVRKESDKTGESLKDLDTRMKSLAERRDELGEKSFLPDDVNGLNKQREAYADLDRQIKSISNSYSRFATARKEGEESLKTDAIKKAEEGFVEAARMHAEVDRLQKLVPASRQPTIVDTAAIVAQKKADEAAANAKRELETRISTATVAYDDWNKTVRSGAASEDEVKRGYRDFASEFSSLSKQFELGGQDALEWGTKAEEASKKAKNAFVESTGGLSGLRAISRGDIGEGLEALSTKFDDLGVRITGVSSFLRGFFDLAKIGLSQQLITGIASLAGGLISVASAAVQAGVALGGVFISGLGQAIPMISIVIASLERFKNILQAVSVAGQAEQQHFYDPTEKQVTQLQNISQLISAQQQLSNSSIQLYEAQQRVRDSQIQLTEARYTAQRQITELSLAEKNARLEAEGANLSLAESRRALTIAIQKGDSAGIQQAELAVKEAELSKRKAEYEIPKASREARLARQRGVSGAPSVISAVEGLEGAKVAVLQAKQAGEAAERQEQITKLQEAARSSKETTYESQLKFLKKGMSPTELGLTESLIGIEKELKSPDSPLKKITDYFVEPFTDAVEHIRGLLKNTSFLEPIDELAKSMGAGLGKLEKATYGPKGTSFFEQMAKDASQNIPIVVEAIEHLMHLFEDIAKAADPAFHKLSESWDNFWASLDKKDSSAQGLTRLEEFFNKGAEYAEKFGKLGVAIYDLFREIGHDAAPQGISTVSSFTEAVKSATEWVKSHGPEVTKFFKEAREGLEVIGQLLFGVGKSLLQVFSLESLKVFSSFIQQILLPAVRLAVEVLGLFTRTVMKLIDDIPGAKDILIGLVAAFAGLEILTRIVGPVKTLYTSLKALWTFMTVMKSTGSFRQAWSAMADVFENVRLKAAGAKVAVEDLGTAETIGAGAAEADTAAQAELETAEAGAGAAGVAGGVAEGAGGSGIIGGLLARLGLGGIGGAGLGTLGIAGAGVAGIAGLGELINATTPGENKYKGLPTEREDYKSRANAEITKFGIEVKEVSSDKFAGGDVFEKISKEATELARNPALGEYKNQLAKIAEEFNPMKRSFKELTESMVENLKKVSPVVSEVAKSFESVSVSTGRIWMNIKNVMKENLEAIRENLGDSSKKGKEAITANFAEAQKKIEESIEKGAMSTSIGMDRIKKLVSQALDKYGVKPSEIEGDLGNHLNKHSVGSKENLSGQQHAAGAYIPPTAGGHHAIVAEAGHGEAILSTDPAHATRSRQILGHSFRAAPHMAEGGEIKAPRLVGGSSVGRVGQASLDIDAIGANTYLSKLQGLHAQISSAAGKLTSSISGPAGTIGTAWTGSWVQIMEQIARAKHWSIAAWRNVINRESGGNPKALGSPTIPGSDAKGLSRAYGLGQFLGGTYTEYSKYGADSSNPDKQIEAMAQYIANDYGTPSGALAHEESFGWYDIGGLIGKAFATGGVIGDQVRRLAVRHLRKKILKFATGGRAPWGGSPVPIIAHEGERIMNPSQYRETARLAGTSPGGLDHHLGYDSSPRQSFADGGPVVVGHKAQPISGSASSTLSLPGISALGINAGEIGSINSLIKVIKAIAEGFSKIGKEKTPEKYKSEILSFFENIEKAFEAMNEGREYLKSKLSKSAVSREYVETGKFISSGKGFKSSGNQGTVALGAGGETKISEERFKALREENIYLEKEQQSLNNDKAKIKEDIKHSKSKTATAMFKAEYNSLVKKQKELAELAVTNIEERYQVEVQTLQDKITEANNAYQTISQEQQTSISSAQQLGNLGAVGGLEQQIKQSAESQLNSLAPLLKEAERLGNTELQATLKQEMTNLRQAITNAIVENITNAQTLIQRESGLAESKTSLLQSLSKVAAQEGKYSESGYLEKQALESKNISLLSTKSAEEALKRQAEEKGDTSAVISLTEELNKNTAEIKENNLALIENKNVIRELVLNQIANNEGVKTGIAGSLKQAYEILGSTTGYVNVSGELGAVKSERSTREGAQSEYEKTGNEFGFKTEGLTPQSLLQYLSSAEAQSIISKVETSGTEGEKASLNKCLSAVEGNSTAILKNSEEIAKLNGQLNQPQTWSTTAWQNFRGAFFGGMGNLLPQYSSVLPAGSAPTEMPKYGEAAAGPSRGGPAIGTLNLTHPVEKLDPALLGEQLSYHIGTTPSMG